MGYWVLAVAGALVVGTLLGWLWALRTTKARLIALGGSVLAILAFAYLLTVTPRGSRSSCIVEGTPVETPIGAVPIERLRVGDRVLGRGGGGAAAVGTVVATRMVESSEHLRLVLENGRDLGVTTEHPIAVGGRWVQAGLLICGAQLDTLNGQARIVRIERRTESVRVYDIEVDSCANFFAGTVLVHNKTWTPRPAYDTPEAKALIGDWLGWDTNRGTIFCRLELREGGNGRCVLLYETSNDPEPEIIPIREWVRTDGEIRIEGTRPGHERPFLMRGSVTKGMLMLQYGGEDGPEHHAPWQGPFQLVDERETERVSDATRKALAGAPTGAGR